MEGIRISLNHRCTLLPLDPDTWEGGTGGFDGTGVFRFGEISQTLSDRFRHSIQKPRLNHLLGGEWIVYDLLIVYCV